MLRLQMWELGISMRALTTPGGASHSPRPVRPSWSVRRTKTVSTLPSASQPGFSVGIEMGMTSTLMIFIVAGLPGNPGRRGAGRYCSAGRAA